MKNDASLRIAYVLLTARRPLSTTEICEAAGAERKTVYTIVDRLELAGFCTEVKKINYQNYYTCRLTALDQENEGDEDD